MTPKTIALLGLLSVCMTASVSADQSVGRGRSSDHNAAPASSTNAADSSTDLLECNQLCQYRKSYETVLLQITYLSQKSAAIQAAAKVGGRDQDILKATETVCTVNSASKCVEQYKVFAAYSLIKLRDHAAYLQDSMAAVTPGRQMDGSIKDAPVVTLSGVSAANYSTNVYTLSEMEEQYQKSGDAGQTLSKAKIKGVWAELVKNGLSSATGTIDFSPKLDKKRVESSKTAGQSTNRQMYYRVERSKDGKQVQDDAFAKYRTTVIQKADRDIARTRESGSDVTRASSMKSLKKDDVISYDAWSEARTNFSRALKTADGQVLPPGSKGKPEPPLGDDEKPQLSGKSSTGVTMTGIDDAGALMDYGKVKKTVETP